MSTVTEFETAIGTTTNGGPRITRIWHVGEHIVRARVALDSHRPQSYALAEVLTPALDPGEPEDFNSGWTLSRPSTDADGQGPRS
jgi:hypothetical protein